MGPLILERWAQKGSGTKKVAQPSYHEIHQINQINVTKCALNFIYFFILYSRYLAFSTSKNFRRLASISSLSCSASVSGVSGGATRDSTQASWPERLPALSSKAILALDSAFLWAEDLAMGFLIVRASFPNFFLLYWMDFCSLIRSKSWSIVLWFTGMVRIDTFLTWSSINVFSAVVSCRPTSVSTRWISTWGG